MDGPLKELAKLEKLTAGASGKGKSPSISDSLDSLLHSLREARDAIQPGAASPDLLLQLSQTVELKKKEVEDRQKEIYSSVSRLGKALDKKFTAALPSYPDVFTSPTSVTALERTIALHFLRTGQFDTAGIFLQEAGLDIPAELRAQFIDLHRILQALRSQDIGPALGWVAKNRTFLRDRASPLEFHLHRSQYIRLLLRTHPPDPIQALAYAKETMAPFYSENEDEFKRLTGCIVFLPLSKLQTSPYADLASPSLHFDLEPLFAKEYCASLGMSRQVPLRVVGDIGGGGALARIEKGRKVMRERKSEWSQSDELPIEIPLPPENRYHSIFACPVSKEQSTETNPPMMMGLSIRELIGLAKEDVDLLDTIIARAGPSATTFPAVFTAYNAVLRERGLDPSEVVFYGKLLKLGTLKGSNWGEKWRMVKLQQGYSDSVQSSHVPVRGGIPMARAAKNPPARITHVDLARKLPRDADSFSLYSHENESTNFDSDGEDQSSALVPQYHSKRPAAGRAALSISSEETSLQSRNHPLISAPSRTRPMLPPGLQMWDNEISDATEHPVAPSTTPPSYRAIVHEPVPPKRRTTTDATRSAIKPSSSSSPVTARQLVAQARERKGSVLNEEDAWKKIQMLQDENHADMFRRDRLLERCWEVWKQGFQWIITTNEQIGDARDNVILRIYIDRWRTRTATSIERVGRVANAANVRVLRSAFGVWRAKTKEREQARWRASMRSKMKIIRDKRELKLMKDALAKWRQSHRSHLADQHYTKSLALRYVCYWRQKLADLDHLDILADEFSRVSDGGILERCWHYWKHESQLQIAHKIVTDSIALRVKTEVMDVWRRQMGDNHVADAYYDIVSKKRVLKSWKSARTRIWTMEKRATAYVANQDRLLLRAVYLVLKARYQSQRLQNITDVRRLKEKWAVWKARMQQHKASEDVAVAFSLRLDSPLADTTLQKWYQVHSSHKNSQAFAAFHYSDALRRKTLLFWRIKLRNKHKIMSKARQVDKYLVTRSAWTTLRAKFAERGRQHRLKALELRRTQNLFYAWFERAHRQRAQRIAEETIQDRITKRILNNALTRWTNRTIDVKNRELQTTIDRDAWLINIAFRKWKGARGRQIEEVSLMESYQFVKREENIRKFFYRWLSAARTTRHRRLTLEKKEDDIKFGLISVAWDKWRDRFKDQRLQPIEYEVMVQGHKNTIFRAFTVWHSKTKSLPAIRFNASCVKARYWNIWLEALPRALQTKAARDMEKKIVLSKFLGKWLQAHQTKIALKAVARARYLRLPPAPTRPAHTTSRPIPTPLSRSAFPRRAVRTEEQNSEADEDKDEPGPSWRERGAGPRTIRSDTSPPRRSQSRFSIPVTRQSSPVRSTFGMRAGRDTAPATATAFPARPASSSAGGEGPSRLLRELRQLQRRPKSPSEHSRSREPP
ncbi:hypothetical protein C8R43DRAFT_1087387 [Mycena crocata]|nr:hypothetical protein C8R43DRAFT_1087387 [Mycena crocata]